MAVYEYTYPSRERWLKARRNRIGGSDAAACMGLNPYKDNVTLWEEKMGLTIPDDISDRPYVRYGTEAEAYLRGMFALDFPEYRMEYSENNMYLNTRYPWMHASLDGVLVTTMKSIRQEILDQIQKVDEGLSILNEVDSPYAGDMKKVFLQNYDIGAAMAERNRLETEQRNREIFLEDQRRRKEEREARERAETEKISRAGEKPQDQGAETGASAAGEPAQQQDPVYEMRFCVHGTREQILKLRDFMKANQISFERI